MESSDEDIMRRVQQGDVQLFEELVRRYRGALIRVTWGKLQDRSLAEDVVQESLLAAFAARHTFDPQYSFRTWLWTITLRLCHKHWKRTSTPRANTQAYDDEQLSPTMSSAPCGLEGVLQTERAELLQRALCELPEAEADAIRLRFFGGLRFDEIAVAMQSSESGAKRRVKHGLERLANQLKTLSGIES